MSSSTTNTETSSTLSPNDLFKKIAQELQEIGKACTEIETLQRPIAPHTVTSISDGADEDDVGYHDECLQYDKTKDDLQFHIKYHGGVMASHVERLARHWVQTQDRSQKLNSEVEALQEENQVLRAKVEMMESEKKMGAIRASGMFQSLLQGDLESAQKATTVSPTAPSAKPSSYTLPKKEASSHQPQPHLCSSACARQHGEKTSSSSSSLSPNSNSTCPHKSILASHIIDRTFDEYKQILRDQLKTALDELEKFKNGEKFKSMQAEIDRLKKLLKERDGTVEELRAKLVEEMTKRSMEKVVSTTPSSSSSSVPISKVGLSSSSSSESKRESLQTKIQIRSMLQYALMQSDLTQFALTYQFQTVMEELLSVALTPKSHPQPEPELPPPSPSVTPLEEMDIVVRHHSAHEAAVMQKAAGGVTTASNNGTGRPLSRHRIQQAVSMLPSTSCEVSEQQQPQQQSITSSNSVRTRGPQPPPPPPSTQQQQMEPLKVSTTHGASSLRRGGGGGNTSSNGGENVNAYPKDPSKISRAFLHQRI